MDEKYRDIKGYEGLYQISNFGNVKRLQYLKYNKLTKTYSIYREHLIKQYISTWGYKEVTLCKNSKLKTKIIHKLVAEAFIPNINNYNCVNHKDGNKLNNKVENLEWCSVVYNIQHAYKNGLMKNNKKIIQYDKKNNIIKKYNSCNIASKETNINQSNISLCALGKRKTAGGYVWRYENGQN